MKTRFITKNALKKAAGFTLIELVLVLTIISLLLASGIYMLTGNQEFANSVRIDGDIKAIENALRIYEGRNQRPPTTEQGLAALIDQPTIEPIPKKWIRSLEGVVTDPWGQPYRYVATPKRDGKSGRKYDIWSIGEDGQDGTEDDAGNWDATAEPKK